MKTHTSAPRTVCPNTAASHPKTARTARALSLLLLLMLLPASMQAGLTYWTDGVEAIVTGYTGSPNTVDIPSTFNGLPVVGIDYGAFDGCGSLTSLTIPDSVATISAHAFEGCASLTNITLGSGVTAIGGYAFYGCSSLTSVTIPANVTSIGTSAFDSCTRLASAAIANGVIGDFAFAFCPALGGVTIGNGVTTIGDHAFTGCTGLGSVTLPGSVTDIGAYAFYNCIRLGSAAITNGVIGDSAFRSCSGLSSVTIGNGVTAIGANAFSDCTSLAGVAVPANVTTIGVSAFYNCASLDSATIAKSVISDSAFASCIKLTRITIGGGVTTIGDSAFSGCASLASLTIPTNVTAIGDSAFAGCTRLATVTINNGIKTIGRSVFSACADMVSVSIPNSVVSIGDSAFSGCFNLADVTIPDSITSIGPSAFSGCSSMTRVVIGNSVTNIGAYAFYGCSSLRNLRIPDSVTHIGDCAFSICYSLASVALGNGLAAIGNHEFAGCQNLTTVSVGKHVTAIGTNAFQFCSSLNAMYFTGNCPALGADALYGVDEATIFYLPTTLGWGPTFCGLATRPGSPPSQIEPGQVALATALLADFSPSSLVGETIIVSTTLPNIERAVEVFDDTSYQELSAHPASGTYTWSKIDAATGRLTLTNTSPGDRNGDVSTVTITYRTAYSGSVTGVVAFAGGGSKVIRGTFTLDVTKPALTITSPTAGQRLPVSSTSWLAKGTARDNIAVSNVLCQLNGGDWVPVLTTNRCTNWSLSISPAPGTNVLSVYATDSSANFSKTNKIIFFYVTPAPLGIQFTGKGTFTPNYTNGRLLEVGRKYAMTAAGAAGHLFSSWVVSTNWSSGVTNTTPTLRFMMQSNLTLLANFKDVTRPTLLITSPIAGQRVLTNNSLWIVKGTAGDNAAVTDVQANFNGAGWQSVGAGKTWQAAMPLNAGPNTVMAYALDAAGNKSPTNKVSFTYVVTSPLTVQTNGTGKVTPNYNGKQLEVGKRYLMTAAGANGFVFTNWTSNLGWVSNRATINMMMESNLVLTANFRDATRPTLSITSPTANQSLTDTNITVTGKAADNGPMAEVFYSLNGGDWAVASTGNGWSNWTANVSLASGTNLLQACAVDAAGNVSITNKVSFVRITPEVLLSGTWNVAAFSTPAWVMWDLTNGLVGGESFEATNGTVIANADGTMSGDLGGPFTGTFSAGANGQVDIVVGSGSSTNIHTLFANAGMDMMLLLEPSTNPEQDYQKIAIFSRAPASLSAADLAGTWTATTFETPARMTWDQTNGLQGGQDFRATNGVMTVNADGTLSGNLKGPFTGTFSTGAAGKVRVNINGGHGTASYTCFVNAGKDTMTLVSAQADSNQNRQSLMIFQRRPASVALAELAGLWNVMQISTPALMTWDPNNGLLGSGEFWATNGTMTVLADGTFSGVIGNAFTGTCTPGTGGKVNVTIDAGGTLQHQTLSLDAKKDLMVLTESVLDSGSDYQHLMLFQRAPATSGP